MLMDTARAVDGIVHGLPDSVKRRLVPPLNAGPPKGPVAPRVSTIRQGGTVKNEVTGAPVGVGEAAVAVAVGRAVEVAVARGRVVAVAVGVAVAVDVAVGRVVDVAVARGRVVAVGVE